MNKPMIWSANKKKSDVNVTIINTMIVVTHTSFHVGHVTLATSWRTSRTNWSGLHLAIPIRSPFCNRPLPASAHKRRPGRANSSSPLM